MKKTINLTAGLLYHSAINHSVFKMQTLYPNLKITHEHDSGWFERQHRITATGPEADILNWQRATTNWLNILVNE
jgi:hypothetical protein